MGRARHVILSWRLKPPYLLYCLCCSFATAVLLSWNLAKGVGGKWNLLCWEYHYWEELLDLAVGVCLIAETVITAFVLGSAFVRDIWCLFDALVVAFTVAS